VEDIEEPLARNLCAHRDCRGVGIELEVGNGVRVGSEKDLAARIDGEAGKIGVEVLAARETVDLDRHTGIGTGRKYRFPTRLEPGTMMKVTTSWVGEDVHFGRVDGSQETFGLITVRIELTVDGRDHAVDLETLTLRYI